jgi:hypothetical protein
VKLFYWDEVDALAQHAPGYAFALASSKEEAVALIVETNLADWYSGTRRELLQQRLRAELLVKEPRVISEPTGFAIFGSA